ncbi:phenylacetate--CoA ligase family protein [Christiangramia flava]|uniref:Capsular polysaccharide biosynthesis protein n=1 Tax=Christiangramia flava JLT2011 TaxID=1229726 RepID=A0A1L7I3C4_9FLAO|nr:phenylacetate--CoA ligase family protein [Christiangramia flava]APU68081.1 capsular polysaccharide biosynthesis protein [Christiangramia flava JLT2011]OSS40583.1 capsular polysaccharide biosynthesis protein [Christiangramia flava JLT2011]
MDWFKLSLQLNQFPINRAMRSLEQIQSIPDDLYAEYVSEKKLKIVQYHLKHNAFYKDFFPEAGKTSLNWEDVPVMRKKDLQQPLKYRMSKDFSRKSAYVGKTSGSSGHPFIFAKDRFAHALSWAGFQDRYKWYGIDLNKSLQARFYGIPLDFYGNIQEKLKDRISLRRRFNIFDLSEEKMEKFLTRFRQSDFDYLNGYTSAILLFAKFISDKGYVLKELCPSLKLCIVTSEKLFEQDQKLMEASFGVPVINEYGASEVGLIAFEDHHGDWIVNSEDLYLEILDENGKVLPHGEEGRVVITSLYNRAHPMIRYDIGDTATLSKKSTAKKPVLEKLAGRTNDIARLADGKVVPGLTFYYVTKTLIEDSGNIKEFIIIQTKLDTFRIEYVSEIPLTGEQQTNILKAIETYVGKDLKINFERKEMLKRSPSGKLKQFTSLV